MVDDSWSIMSFEERQRLGISDKEYMVMFLECLKKKQDRLIEVMYGMSYEEVKRRKKDGSLKEAFFKNMERR
ncbi:MAG: hypothetical protein ABIF11_02245 [Nitrospirota bacterium]